MGIGETLHRALAKLIMRAAGYQAKTVCGNLQLCAGLDAGIEGATHDVGQRRVDRVKTRREETEEEEAAEAEEDKEESGEVDGLLSSLFIEGDGGEPFIVNRELCSHQFLLGVLETIYVLGDAWVFGPPAEGGREEGDTVGGLEAAAAALEACEKVTERHLVVEGRLFFQWEDPGVFYDGDKERAPGALERFDESLKLNLHRPQALGVGADGVGDVGNDAVVVGGEGNRHAIKRQTGSVLCFVLVIGEQDVRKVDRAAGDVDRLQGVDKRLVETLGIVVVRTLFRSMSSRVSETGTRRWCGRRW